MTPPLAVNSRVAVRITRAITSGLLGQVDGERAIIRRREIAWSGPQPDASYVDHTLPAIVLGYNPVYREVELSLRLAERDPWPDIQSTYPVGSVVTGRVIGLIRDAAFIEIEPAVEGFLHANELLAQSVEHIEDWLWIGDPVKALVTEVDPLRRRLRLSLKDLLARRESQQRTDARPRYQEAAQTTVASALRKDIRQQLLRLDAITKEPDHRSILQVLVVEDDEVSGPAFVRFLKRNACDVMLEVDAVKALDEVRARTTPLDVILVDRGLPGLTGDEFVRQLQQDKLSSRLVMVLEQEQIADQPDVWKRIEDCGVDVLLKGDEEQCQTGIVAILDEVRRSQPTCHFPSLASRRTESLLPAGAHLSLDVQQDAVKSILGRLKTDTDATTVSILAFDGGRRRLTALHNVGKPFNAESASPDIAYSPLGDVLLKGESVEERDAQRSARFERLRGLQPLQGFIGVPISGTEDVRYALIMLREDKPFDGTAKDLARSAAYVVSAVLAGSHLMQVLQPWQAQNLAGQLTAAAIHEISNKLLATKMQIEDLQQMVADLWRQPEKAGDAEFLHSMEDSLEQVAVARQEATLLRQQYLSLTASDDTQLMDMNEVVASLVRLLRAEGRAHDVAFVVSCTDDLPSVRGRPSQVRQILLNVLLNAIQQMKQIGRRGQIHVETRCVSDSALPVQIWITDEGPGIHAHLAQRVFEFGFTTRKGGAGLGLTISRQAARSLGGELRIDSSFALWGSTFVLEMPQGA